MQGEKDYLKLIQTYKLRLKRLEDRLNSELKARDREIEIYKEEIEYLRKLVTTLSERTIINNNTLEARAMTDQSKSETRTVSFHAPIQGAGYVEGNNHYYAAPEQKQSLTEAAVEIQELLNQLSQTYPSTTLPEQMVVATKAMEEIEKKPQLKQRVIGALQSGGVEALRELIDNPVVNVLLAVLEGWKST